MMQNLVLPLIVTIALAAGSAADAACFADYKAKQDSPLRLHYGVIELADSACGSRSAARNAAGPRLEQNGWTLLGILSTFGEDGLAERKDSAGAYFLRF